MIMPNELNNAFLILMGGVFGFFAAAAVRNLPEYIFNNGKLFNFVSIRQSFSSLKGQLLFLSVFSFSVFSVIYFDSMTAPWGLVFFVILLVISVIDIEHQIIPDTLSLSLLWLGLIANSFDIFTSAQNAIVGAALGYLIFWFVLQGFYLVTNREGMGHGDLKLFAALCAWFGVGYIPQLIFIASLSSIVTVLLLSFVFRKGGRDRYPFGPFLALSGGVSFFSGDLIEKLFDLYLF